MLQANARPMPLRQLLWPKFARAGQTAEVKFGQIAAALAHPYAEL
jgi:hypothetical protein